MANPEISFPSYEVVCDALIIRADIAQPDKAKRYTVTLDLIATPTTPSPLAAPQRLPSWSVPLSEIATETVMCDGRQYAIGEIAALVVAAVDVLKQRALNELSSSQQPQTLDNTAE